MRARLTKVGAAVAMLAALAFGGSALASAASKQAPAPQPVQQQSTADSGPNVQQGDQSAPDTGSSNESSSEASAPESDSQSEAATASDGPGGYADTVANADTQQTGEH